MSWFTLCTAGLLEVVGVILLKRITRSTKHRVAAWVILATVMAGSLYLLSLSLKSIPVGTAYAVWTGIGTVGSVVLGMLFFGETYTGRKLLYLASILVGIVGLRLTS
jgi:multidrug transporter EmrE-like cation transporter